MHTVLLFSMYVKDEETAKQLEIAATKFGKKLKANIEMKYQWVWKGKKMVVACDFYKYTYFLC